MSSFRLCQAEDETEEQRQMAQTAGERRRQILRSLLTYGPGVVLTENRPVGPNAVRTPVASKQLLSLQASSPPGAFNLFDQLLCDGSKLQDFGGWMLFVFCTFLKLQDGSLSSHRLCIFFSYFTYIYIFSCFPPFLSICR